MGDYSSSVIATGLLVFRGSTTSTCYTTVVFTLLKLYFLQPNIPVAFLAKRIYAKMTIIVLTLAYFKH